MKRFLFMLMLCVLIATPALAAPSYSGDMAWSRGDAGSTWQEWTFSSNANPTAPDSSYNPYGDVSAAISGTGTIYFESYSGASGVWGGDPLNVTLTIANNEELNNYKEIWLEVIYRLDAESPSILPSFTTNPVATVELLSFESTPLAPGTIQWYSGVYHWLITPNPYSEQICLQFTGTGGYVDSVSVDTICANTVPAPGAILLGSLGVGLVGWMRRRRAM